MRPILDCKFFENLVELIYGNLREFTGPVEDHRKNGRSFLKNSVSRKNLYALLRCLEETVLHFFLFHFSLVFTVHGKNAGRLLIRERPVCKQHRCQTLFG